jgi:tripartite-type tricarboxylate transporter receptor subunit TctC
MLFPKLKRYWLVSVVFLVCLSILAGCSQPASPPSSNGGKSESTEEYPNKPVEIIVSWAPGGSTDLTARLISSLITPHLGQSLVTVNRPGGATVPGHTEIAQAEPDGYTIGLSWYAAYSLRTNTLECPYTIDDVEYILGLVRQRNVIAVRKDSPFQTLDDLVKYAKEHPGELTFSTPGASSWQHMIGAHFNQVAQIETTHVPYDGGRPAAVAAIGGHVDYVVGQPAEFYAELESGDIRMLAAMEKERIPAVPDIPTATELGYEVAHPHMLIIVAPKGVPQDRIQKIHDSIKAVVETEEFNTLATNMNLEVEYMPGEEVEKEVRELHALYAELAPLILEE